MVAAGARVRTAADVVVARRPPDSRHFRSQRVRQAYDDLAQPVRLVCELSLLPGLVALARRSPAAVLLVAVAAVAVAELKRTFGEVSAVVVTRNLGMTVAQSTALRGRMREAGASYKVTKNTLTLIALEGLLMFLPVQCVNQLWRTLAEHLPGAMVIADLLSDAAIGKSQFAASVHKQGVQFTWGVASGKNVSELHPEFTWLRETNLADKFHLITPPRQLEDLPVLRRMSNNIATFTIT